MLKSLRSLGIFFLVFFMGVSWAQSETSGADQMVGEWDVTVESQKDTERRLKVKSFTKKTENNFILEASFGFAGFESELYRVSSAEIVVTNGVRTLNLTARSGARIVATQNDAGWFVGTWFSNQAQESPVTLKKLSEEMFPELKIVPEGTPPECASFLGGWTAKFPSAQWYLWVVEVKVDCTVKYRYSAIRNPRVFRGEAKISQGVLPITLQRGTNYFSFTGGVLRDRYIDNDNVEIHRDFTKIK